MPQVKVKLGTTVRKPGQPPITLAGRPPKPLTDEQKAQMKALLARTKPVKK